MRVVGAPRRCTTQLVVWTGLVLASCSPGSEAKQHRTLDLAGPLDAAMWKRVSEVSWGDIDSVTVQSRGGDPAIAVRVARALKDSGKPVKIDGLCASACLMIAVINNGKVAFSDSSTLIAHNTASSVYYMALKTYPNISASYYYPRMKAEKDWFVENGVDPRLLLLPQFMIDTPCLRGPEVDDPFRYREITYMAAYAGWIIPPETAASFGMRASGWQTGLTEVAKIGSLASADAARKRYSTEAPGEPILSQSEHRLASVLYYVDACPGEADQR